MTNENEIRNGDIYDKNVSAIIRNELEEYVNMKGLLKSEKDIEMIAMEISKKYALNIPRQLIARKIREYDYIDLNKK